MNTGYFDPLYQPYASNRYCQAASNGMAATGSSLASEAALSVMKRGGNAADAAVACAAALTVLEPTSNGLGSDAFAIVWSKGKMYGLNASGYSPRAINIEEVRQRTRGRMPAFGWLPVMVPGAVASWSALVERFGKLSLMEDLEPAVFYAEEGYPAGPLLAEMWQRYAAELKAEGGDDPAFREWFRTFTRDGEPYAFGDIVRLPDLAKSLRLIGETGGKAFYEGEIAEQFVRQSRRDGGYFTMEDLAGYRPEWVNPVSVSYRGFDVWELPPNGQGITALIALNILKNFDLASMTPEDRTHVQIEAVKAAFADTLKYVTDPADMDMDFHVFLRDEYGRKRAGEIGNKAKIYAPYAPYSGGTVYLCTADKEGGMVSFIQSNYKGFGSGIVLEGYGVSLQNRGADFSLDPSKANVLRPHKRSYHTIIPGFLTKDRQAVGPFGVMGAYMQPQGHVQVLSHLLDEHLNPQMALDAPRWQWLSGNKIQAEASMAEKIKKNLCARGHDVQAAADSVPFGRGQMILRLGNGVLVGGTESRTDGGIACY